MIITRSIGGKHLDFELTPDELYDAFREQEFLFDREDCKAVIDDLADDEIFDTYGVTAEQFMAHLDDMAAEKRRNMNKYDMDWEYARDEAIRAVIRWLR